MDYRDPAPEYAPVPKDYEANPEEFSTAPEIPSTVSEEEKEYEYRTGEETSGSRRASKFKRALLIQAAAVMVGAVVILDGFGVDHLGMDALIGDHDRWEEPWDEPNDEPWDEPTYDDRAVEEFPEKDSKWPTRVNVHGHVTYNVTGETFDFDFQTNEDFSYDDGMKDVRSRVRSLGADPDSMELVEAKNSGGSSLQKSDDAIIVGSGDSPESIYLASGELWWEYDREEWYEVDASGTSYTDSFPELPNPDPDFAGDYAWAGSGSEEYLILEDDAGTHFLVAGTYYTSRGQEIYPGDSSVYYDRERNTLVLNYYFGNHLDANVMGNGFTIELHGENEIGSIRIYGAMYGGSVTFTGDGSLKINPDKRSEYGLHLACEDSESCIMVDREATVEISGQYAVVVDDTLLDNAIFTLEPIAITDDTSFGSLSVSTAARVDERGNVVADPDGRTLYQGTVIDAFGNRAEYVKFAPK